MAADASRDECGLVMHLQDDVFDADQIFCD